MYFDDVHTEVNYSHFSSPGLLKLLTFWTSSLESPTEQILIKLGTIQSWLKWTYIFLHVIGHHLFQLEIIDDSKIYEQSFRNTFPRGDFV